MDRHRTPRIVHNEHSVGGWRMHCADEMDHAMYSRQPTCYNQPYSSPRNTDDAQDAIDHTHDIGGD